jgi:DNA topoisomerase I
MRTLVIVESGAKAKIIGKYLNASPEVKARYGQCDVVACFGHIMDLERKGLGIDVANGFKPDLHVIPDKQKLVKELKARAAKSDWVLLASDADREGAAIAKHLQTVLGKKHNYKRITFNEITPNALKNAVLNAGDIDEHLVLAQQARRVLDRLVGYEISPLLWQHFKNGGLLRLSAGRVQSATLNILVTKHQDAIAFQSTSYYTLQGMYGGGQIAQLYSDNGKGTVVHLESYDKVRGIQKKIVQRHNVENVFTKSKSESPPKPFATPTMQQEAHTKLGLSVGSTMKLAQDLYEAGLITYMRTDSINLSVDARVAIRGYIENTFGTKYVSSSANESGSKKTSKHSQEAHECIRPTDVTQTQAVGKNMSKQHSQLYELIWKRTVASIMSKMIYDETVVIITEPSLLAHEWAFVIKTKVVVFDGFTRVYGAIESIASKTATTATIFEKGSFVDCEQVFGHQVWSSPPSRYNDASLIKVMEANGIGRPSTYASVLSKLTEKQYVEKKTLSGIEKTCTDIVWTPSSRSCKDITRTVVVGEDKNKMVPTDIGISVNKFIATNFKLYTDADFTASMETELDRLAKGETKYKALMTGFWKELDESLKVYKRTSAANEQTTMDLDKGRVVTIGKMEYTLRRTKYGPAIQYEQAQGDGFVKKFVSLKAYLKITGMADIKDMEKGDIRLLVSLPRCMNRDEALKLHYGQYGFYLKNQAEKSFSMFIGKHYTREDVPDGILDLPKDVLEKITSWTPKAGAKSRQAT